MFRRKDKLIKLGFTQRRKVGQAAKLFLPTILFGVNPLFWPQINRFAVVFCVNL